ncbi:MAG: hypothetical protein PF505_03505 [Vallitaleaceae bacterium]|jgi:uncharacterized membrane protein|nr:hypothetical protein [Vallitaleaceae bacterium]
MKETNRWINVVAYFVFFVPILVDGENESYKFHANQGLVLLILFIGVSILGTIVPVIGWFIILPLGSLLCFILAIIGIVNAYSEKQKELPVIGKYKIIK